MTAIRLSLMIELNSDRFIKSGQEIPRVSSTSGNASGNGFEDTFIPAEYRTWECEIKLRRNRASEADQRDCPGKQ
jgi:hypothetical protein